jgi:hypothetical protein
MGIQQSEWLETSSEVLDLMNELVAGLHPQTMPGK